MQSFTCEAFFGLTSAICCLRELKLTSNSVQFLCFAETGAELTTLSPGLDSSVSDVTILLSPDIVRETTIEDAIAPTRGW